MIFKKVNAAHEIKEKYTKIVNNPVKNISFPHIHPLYLRLAASLGKFLSPRLQFIDTSCVLQTLLTNGRVLEEEEEEGEKNFPTFPPRWKFRKIKIFRVWKCWRREVNEHAQQCSTRLVAILLLMEIFNGLDGLFE